MHFNQRRLATQNIWEDWRETNPWRHAILHYSATNLYFIVFNRKLGNKNNGWQDFLRTITQSPEECVTWSLSVQVGTPSMQMSGVQSGHRTYFIVDGEIWEQFISNNYYNNNNLRTRGANSFGRHGQASSDLSTSPHKPHHIYFKFISAWITFFWQNVSNVGRGKFLYCPWVVGRVGKEALGTRSRTLTLETGVYFPSTWLF